MRLLNKNIIILIVLLSLFSCGKDSACFKSTGKIIKEQRLVSADVNSITTADNIDIVLTQSITPSLTLEGGANLLPYINTDIEANELNISSDNKCGMFRDYNIPITAYLSLPNVANISYTGQGNITSANKLMYDKLIISSNGGTGNVELEVDVNEISIQQHSGPADFAIKGRANYSYIYTLGEGWFDQNSLKVNNVHVNHSGTGNVYVKPLIDLNIELRSSGDLIYSGSPNLKIAEHSGSGRIIKK
ncbi:MAG: head GIN domain-containing protein [Vicingaceae bacterium]